MLSKKMRGNMLLLLTAFIWGSTVVAQSVGMDYIGPFTFNAARNFIGAAVLLPVILIFKKMKKNQPEQTGDMNKSSGRKTLWIGGICCGIMLFLSCTLQQIGIQYTTVGKTGFITAMYIILVPVFGIFLGKKVPVKIWIGIGLATVGLYLLCINEGFSIGKGDLLILACAVFFALHILVIDHFAPKVDGVKMSCIQFVFVGVLSLAASFIFEEPSMGDLASAWFPLVYAGVLSSGVAYTLQIVAQKDTDPTVASLILSLESVFSVVAGVIVLRESFSAKEAVGCALMFCAIMLSQLPDIRKVRKGIEVEVELEPEIGIDAEAEMI